MKLIHKLLVFVLVFLIIAELYFWYVVESDYAKYFGNYGIDSNIFDISGYLFGKCTTPCKGIGPCPLVYVCTPVRAIFILPLLIEFVGIWYLLKAESNKRTNPINK